MPQLLIVDLGLPDGKGEDLITQFSFHENCHILVNSNLSESKRILKALKNGAHGYLHKEDNHTEISTALNLK